MSSIETPNKLTPAAEFERSGRCPVNLRWLIFLQKESLQKFGALLRYGKRRWIVDEERFIDWLREYGEGFSTPHRKTPGKALQKSRADG